MDEEDLQTVVRALENVLAVTDLTMLLPKIKDYAILALESPSTAVKLLGVEQLSRMTEIDDIETQRSVVGALFSAMQVSLAKQSRKGTCHAA